MFGGKERNLAVFLEDSPMKEQPTYEGNGKRIAYISGAITENPGYLEQFVLAENHLENSGYVVLNPVVLPEGMAHEKYLPINDAMISVCDEFFLIPGWEDSSGVAHEIRTATALGIPIKELPETLFNWEETV